MYLLNPIKDPTSLVYVEFTFHYVSIKSLSFATYGLYISKFTFHYVSIKSEIDYKLYCLYYKIYIPLCIY